ncbi:hypothetical protein SAMN05660284_01602 [Formivibrio citricus]|uniref:Uncharacterized protein n=1 Tax=Formivibrio citricus TaxID=83765 RepID=A0A1I4ZEN2_9NEIS|nr:hypothetical protein [Formivibrio citricus]SFN48493.1 hypothetical protein SAMN05660284_01602 [Formivibrio citricus]
MNRLIALLSLIALVLCGPAVALPLNPTDGPSRVFEVVSADFGLFNSAESGRPLFESVKVVPLTPDQSYGWVILLRTNKPTIKWREEFTLPTKPDTWGAPESQGTRSVSTDGRVSITEREVSPERGIIFNSWAVAPGDPKGRYVIRVFIEGSLAHVFEFDVQ